MAHWVCYKVSLTHIVALQNEKQQNRLDISNKIRDLQNAGKRLMQERKRALPGGETYT